MVLSKSQFWQCVVRSCEAAMVVGCGVEVSYLFSTIAGRMG